TRSGPSAHGTVGGVRDPFAVGRCEGVDRWGFPAPVGVPAQAAGDPYQHPGIAFLGDHSGAGVAEAGTGAGRRPDDAQLVVRADRRVPALVRLDHGHVQLLQDVGTVVVGIVRGPAPAEDAPV